jgi:hypothetical protein
MPITMSKRESARNAASSVRPRSAQTACPRAVAGHDTEFHDPSSPRLKIDARSPMELFGNLNGCGCSLRAFAGRLFIGERMARRSI